MIAKAKQMGRELAAKRERLKELQRAARRPGVRSVREQDVVASLGGLRDLLQGDDGAAAQLLKALVGDVVIEARKGEGKKRPEMQASFTINAIPALAALDRGREAGGDSPAPSVWSAFDVLPPEQTAEAPARPSKVLVALATTASKLLVVNDTSTVARRSGPS